MSASFFKTILPPIKLDISKCCPFVGARFRVMACLLIYVWKLLNCHSIATVAGSEKEGVAVNNLTAKGTVWRSGYVLHSLKMQAYEILVNFNKH